MGAPSVQPIRGGGLLDVVADVAVQVAGLHCAEGKRGCTAVNRPRERSRAQCRHSFRAFLFVAFIEVVPATQFFSE